jgi:alcohol dehydrogenase (cytochrome c)
LWQTRLPAQAEGGTVTYAINGRQYIAITAGGGGPAPALVLGMTPEADTPSGSNAVYVFALPQ